MPFTAAEPRLILLQAERHRERLWFGQEDERSEELVPSVEEREQRDDRERRAREGQNHAPKDGKFAATIDARGIGEFAGNGQEELAQQEDVEGATEEAWHPEW